MRLPQGERKKELIDQDTYPHTQRATLTDEKKRERGNKRGNALKVERQRR